jgi:hypothetical protein
MGLREGEKLYEQQPAVKYRANATMRRTWSHRPWDSLPEGCSSAATSSVLVTAVLRLPVGGVSSRGWTRWRSSDVVMTGITSSDAVELTGTLGMESTMTFPSPDEALPLVPEQWKWESYVRS